MNRKLIRTTLAEVKGKAREVPQPRERSNGSSRASNDGGERERERTPPRVAQQSERHSPVQVKKRVPPPSETNAEIFYYKKQIDAHTPMVLVLLDGEEIEGTIEWYDLDAIKINRQDAPNLFLPKHSIKYMYKAEDREK